MLNGVFTATEGSAIAVVYSLILSFIYKEIEPKDLPSILLDSAKMTAIVIFMIGVSSIMSWVMAFTNIPFDKMFHISTYYDIIIKVF
ncbi:TRAP transporter large permease subunit [Crassaminicella profunda]|uniref:TRAP transporter large permease subunit n=1 Tax=Crassaminicella profunda TaxID=1286698 RepID=UPI003CCEC727